MLHVVGDLIGLEYIEEPVGLCSIAFEYFGLDTCVALFTAMVELEALSCLFCLDISSQFMLDVSGTLVYNNRDLNRRAVPAQGAKVP